MRLSLAALAALIAGGSLMAAELKLTPGEVVLRGQASRQQLLVTGVQNGRPVDLTRRAVFATDTPAVVRISADGVVQPVGTGTGTVSASLEGLQLRATVRVADGDRFLPVTLERDIIPILTRLGCNAGACHGKQRGQNGFQLSLLGFDADFDFHALAHEARGRRVFPAAPDMSLLLTKPTGRVPHGGGKRLAVGDLNYEVLRRWIAAGMPRDAEEAPKVARVTVQPAELILANGAEQQLLVMAHYSDGTSADVTHLAGFQSNESVIAAVSPDGRIKAGPILGEAAIMARFQQKFAVCNVAIPLPTAVPAEVYTKLPRQNFIDGLVWNQLQRLNLLPSEPAGDATFLRRAYLDVIGRLPTPEEVQAFLGDPEPTKRARLIERLLDRPEYADFWANKWADLLRPNPYRVGVKAVYNLDAWLRESFRRNKPYDQFVREILTAQGSTFREGAAVIFRDRREPDEIANMMSQLFLGVRLECARCHHHPFEVWGQDEFYSFAAYFSRIGRKGTGLSPPISGSEEILFLAPRGEVKHPATGKVMAARPLFGQAPDLGGRDPRQVLADWVLSAENPYFARVIVNRVWADLMGRGLVEPVDDLRATNPPSNPALLDALAADFRKQGHDLKKLIRTITGSYVYGLGSLPNDHNAADLRNYSRHYRQRLRAEVLLDAICDITEVPETFAAMPLGSRATELWTVRSQSIFLDSFGRPDPNQDPPCERTSDSSVVQALHLMNAPGLHRKVTSDAGRAARLAASSKTPREIVDEIYGLVYSRRPSENERAECVKLFEGNGASRRQVIEDLMWAMVNTPEFVFKD